MNRRERKKEETRENIIDCAASFFREKGFQETSMEEIAKKSDVSKGTLYNYFKDKESILVGYFQVVIADYGKQIKEKFTESKDMNKRYTLFFDETDKKDLPLVDGKGANLGEMKEFICQL